MAKLNRFSIFLIAAALLVGVFAIDQNRPEVQAAQSREERIGDLRQQIEELERQAQQYRESIQNKQGEADSLEREISILNSRIGGLQREIDVTSASIEKTELEIVDLEEAIFEINDTMEKHKDSIGLLLNEMYERDQESTIALILKSDRISDFALETQQTESLNQQLGELVDALKERKTTLEAQRDTLNGKRTELSVLNDQTIAQASSLRYNRNKKDNLLDTTKGEEAEYQKLLRDVEAQRQQFFAELEILERNARETGAFIVHVTAHDIPPKGTVLFQWPYANYTFTQGYGYTSFARSGAYNGAIHNGIDVVAGCGSPIRSIGDGVVLSGGTNNGWGNWVAIEHNNGFVSLYGHMAEPPRLGNKTRINAGDVIGFEGTTGYSTGCHLHLSLYKDFFTYVRQSNGQVYFNYSDGSINPLDYLP